MELKCPQCKKVIPTSEINISADIAKCTYCNNIYKASELVNTCKMKELLIPPGSSKIKTQEILGGGYEIFMPNKVFKLKDIASLGFIVIWVVFITIWTVAASVSGSFSVLFSIPFWIAAIIMILATISSFNETQTLKLSGNSLILIKHNPINKKKTNIKISNIQNVRMKHLNTRSGSNFAFYRYLYKMKLSVGSSSIELPAIIHDDKTEYFFESSTEAEQEWVIKFINAFIRRNKTI
ncbi:MAG: hypothetical protein GY756_09730 [bacterium]|nr:hypothetical protein [bacterium]